MVGIGTVGTIITAIDLLREVLEKSGVDKAKAAQIAGEFLGRLRNRGAAPATGSAGVDTSAAFVEERWEYRVVTLVYEKPRRGVRRLVVKLVDGRDSDLDGSTELSAELNALADERWEVLTALGGEAAPTLLMRRERR